MKHKITGDFTSWNWSIYEFYEKMKNIAEDEEIILEMNSYGGDVFLSIDMCNALRSHPGHVTAIITGIAASAASIAIMGANTIKAYSNTQVMIHNAWTIVAGNAVELRKAADDLDSIGESVLASYTHRIDASQAKKLLEEETFLSAAKAKEIGLIDEVIQSEAAEEVESEIFQDKIKVFNDSIKDGSAGIKIGDIGKVAANIAAAQQAGTGMKELEELIKNMIETYNEKKEDEFEIPGEKKPGENPPGDEPKQSAIKTMFLNL
jgi:ATP-dependent Clp protease, protease subunit